MQPSQPGSGMGRVHGVWVAWRVALLFCGQRGQCHASRGPLDMSMTRTMATTMMPRRNRQ